ncbi:hypothetical protein L1887_59356 [Cichorium endivia]|nr:hypothetical protein L1887_59356 [Cichorium endivia]
MLSRTAAGSRLPALRPRRPPSANGALPRPRPFTQHSKLQLVTRHSLRPQLPYLSQPHLVRRLSPLDQQVLRLLSTETKRYVKDQTWLALRWTAIGWTFLILAGISMFGIQIELDERKNPTPTEWTFWTKHYLRSARGSKEDRAGVGIVDWARVASSYLNALGRLEGEQDGKDVMEQADGEGIVIPDVGKAERRRNVQMGSRHREIGHVQPRFDPRLQDLPPRRPKLQSRSSPRRRSAHAQHSLSPDQTGALTLLDAATSPTVYPSSSPSSEPTARHPSHPTRTSAAHPPPKPEGGSDIDAAVSMITSLFTAPVFPPEPPSGDRPVVRETPLPTCEEGELMLYIGEILFATSPASTEGLSWTKQATMLLRLAEKNVDVQSREGGQSAGWLEWRGWFGGGGSAVKGKTLEEARMGVLESEMQEVEKLKEKIAKEVMVEDIYKHRGSGGGGVWVG